MFHTAIISVKGSTSRSVPINVAFRNEAEYRRSGRQTSIRHFHYTLEIGILKEDGGYPEYNPPSGNSESLDNVIKYLRGKGFEPLYPLIENAYYIKKFIKQEAFQYLYVGGPSMKDILRKEGIKRVRELQNYIHGFNAPSLKESTIKTRKSRQKNHGDYYKYPEGINHPLVETGLLEDSISFRITKLDDGELKFTKQTGRGRPKLTEEEKESRRAEKEEYQKRKKEEEAKEKKHVRQITKKAKPTDRPKRQLKKVMMSEDAKKMFNVDTGMFFVDEDAGTISIPDDVTRGHPFTFDAINNADEMINKLGGSLMYTHQVQMLRRLSLMRRLGVFNGIGKITRSD